MYMYGVTANDRQEGFLYRLESSRAWLMEVALILHDHLAKGMLKKYHAIRESVLHTSINDYYHLA
jgi:hypothetical protein